MINTGETTSQALQAPYEADFSRVHFMFALPRSRTQWMCHFLGHAPNVDTWHDPLAFCRSPQHLADKIHNHLRKSPADRRLFIADTSSVMFYRSLKAALPGMNVMTMRRDATSICESLRRQVGSDMAFMVMPCYERLLQIIRLELEAGNYENHFEFHLDLGNMVDIWAEVSGDKPMLASWLHEVASTVIGRPIRGQPHSDACVEALLKYSEVRIQWPR